MSKKIVVLGPLPPPLGGVSIHLVRYIELLKSTSWKATAYSYTGTTRTGRLEKFREILQMFIAIYLRVNPGTWDVLHLHYGGMGLGLALSKNLVELHGGKIWMKSQKGKGSTFSFSIPIGTSSKE